MQEGVLQSGNGDWGEDSLAVDVEKDVGEADDGTRMVGRVR